MAKQDEGASGPLTGTTILEVGGIGPLPLYGMLMADLGARIIRVDRADGGPRTSSNQWVFRGRESVTIDIRQPAGLALLLDLVERVDVLVEGYRPGVAERLGFGPDVCLARNPALVYGRMTGWGGHGPLANKGGHDLNYVAISGALGSMGPADRPPPVPLNLAGDYGGGAMMLAYGTLAALLEARRSGVGQTVEAGMSDGTLALMSQIFSLRDSGMWTEKRQSNLIDGAAHFYGCYETSDGNYVALGAVEGKFYANVLKALELDPALAKTQMNSATWPEMCERFAEIFKTRTRAEWEAVFADLDACFSPVLTMSEAFEYPHNVERGSIVTRNGVKQVAPPVRFGVTKEQVASPARDPGADNDSVLAELGLSADRIAALREASIVG